MTRAWLALILSGCALACAEDAEPQRESGPGSAVDGESEAPGPSEGCELAVSDAWIEHACFHSTLGPFRERAATPLDRAPEVDVSRAHTAFTLALAPQGHEFAGHVQYVARATGRYALFLSEQARVTLARDGESIARLTEHDTELCPELPWVVVFPLEVGAHSLVIEHTTSTIMMVLEHLEEGGADSLGERCAPPQQDAGVMAPRDSGAAMDSGEPRPEDGGGAPESDAGAPMLDAAAMVDAAFDAAPLPTDAPINLPDADGASAAPDAAVVDAGCLIDPVLEHSCIHVMNGPYMDVAASASTTSAPNVNAVHHVYRVQRASPDHTWLTYRPNETAEFVFYASAGNTVIVHGADAPLPVKYMEPVPPSAQVAACPGLEHAIVVELEQARRYSVQVVHPTSAAAANLLIENVNALAPNGWAERTEACE